MYSGQIARFLSNAVRATYRANFDSVLCDDLSDASYQLSADGYRMHRAYTSVGYDRCRLISKSERDVIEKLDAMFDGAGIFCEFVTTSERLSRCKMGAKNGYCTIKGFLFDSRLIVDALCADCEVKCRLLILDSRTHCLHMSYMLGDVYLEAYIMGMERI